MIGQIISKLLLHQLNMKKLIIILIILFVPNLVFADYSDQCSFDETDLYGDEIAYYKLENLLDSSSSYDLTNQNSVSFSSALIDNGADYGNPNTNKALYRNDSYSILGSDSYTVMMWFQIYDWPPSGDGDMIYSKMFADASGYIESCRYFNNSGTKQMFCSVIRNSPTNITYNTNLSTSTWYHLALVRTGSTKTEVYLNGVSIGSSAQTGTSNQSANTTRFVMGSEWNLSQNFLPGLIDEAVIFDRVLTGTEILDYYNGDLCPEETAIVASTSLSCDPDWNEDIGHISACRVTSTTTDETITNYYVPFFIWFSVAIPFIWIAGRLFIEILIRWRKK